MWFLLMALMVLSAATSAALLDARRAWVIKLVTQIQRADYAGDRAALKRLAQELAPFAEDKAFGDKVRYWRGFALWRRAINGFNENVGRGELQQDLQSAADEFEAALKPAPSFVDAKIAAIGALGTWLFFDLKNSATREFNDPVRAHEIIAKVSQWMKEAQAAEPDNPRLMWVLGPNVYAAPPERGGPDKAIELYLKGLQTIRTAKPKPKDSLAPIWGEPELLMSLAWTQLNRSQPDLAAAERYAKEALALVPYWHYVKDILLSQIAAAKAKQP
jgi:hypothetical protein